MYLFPLGKVIFVVVVVLRTHAPLNFSETPHIYTNHQIQILINVQKDWKTLRPVGTNLSTSLTNSGTLNWKRIKESLLSQRPADDIRTFVDTVREK